MFLPKYVGIIQLDLFYEKNILPSALTLLLSPVLPAVAKNKKLGCFLYEYTEKKNTAINKLRIKQRLINVGK